jgi:hypothetical protein
MLKARRAIDTLRALTAEVAVVRTAQTTVVFAAAAMLGATLPHASVAAVKAPDPAGQVRFLNHANSNFDRYTQSPTDATQAWMRDHYARMLAYHPYFDTRLQWYPFAWVYKNAYAINSSSSHPEWILRDANGNMLYIPWGCSNGVCPQFAGDFGNVDFRANWIREARLALNQGYLGLFVDDVNLTWRVGDGNGNQVVPIDPRTGASMTLTNWRRYFAEFMEEIRAAFPDIEIGHNAIWYAGSADDSYIKRQIAASDYFNIERGATDEGLTGGAGTFGFETFLSFVDAVHALGSGVVLMDYGSTVQQREYALAAWFLLSEGTDLVSSDQLAWAAPDMWWAGYELDLGDAKGKRYSADGTLRRDFACGTVLLNQPGMPRRTVTLDPPMRRIDGAQVTSVTLDASSAAVLRADCAKPSPPYALGAG